MQTVAERVEFSGVALLVLYAVLAAGMYAQYLSPG